MARMKKIAMCLAPLAVLAAAFAGSYHPDT